MTDSPTTPVPSRRWFRLRRPHGWSIACALFVALTWIAGGIILFRQMSADEIGYMPIGFWAFWVAGPSLSLLPYFVASADEAD